MPIYAFPVLTPDLKSLKTCVPFSHTCFAPLPGLAMRQVNHFSPQLEVDVMADRAFILYVKAPDYKTCKAWADAVNADQLKRRYNFVLKAEKKVKGIEGVWWSIQWPVGTVWDEAYAVTKLIFKHITYGGSSFPKAPRLVEYLKLGLSADQAMILAALKEPNGYALPCGSQTYIDRIRDYLDNGPWFSRDPKNGWSMDVHLGDSPAYKKQGWGGAGLNFNISASHKPFNPNLHGSTVFGRDIRDHEHFLQLIK